MPFTTLFEDSKLRDEPRSGPAGSRLQCLHGDPRLDDYYTDNLPEVHGVMRQLRRGRRQLSGDRKWR